MAKATKTIGELVINLTTEMASFRRDLKTAQKEVTEFGEKITGTLERVKGIWMAGMEAMGVAASLEFVHRMTESMDEMGKLAQKVSMNVQELSQLSYVADLADVNMDVLAKGIKNLSASMAGMEDPTALKGASATITRLVGSLKNADGSVKSSKEVLLELSDVFARMPEGYDKVALAAQVFGKKVGPELLPFLNQGRQGIEQLMQEAEKFGLTISTESAARAEEFNDNLKRLEYAAKGAGIAIAQAALPSLVHLTEQLVAFSKDSRTREYLKDLDYLFRGLAVVVVETIAPLHATFVSVSNDIRDLARAGEYAKKGDWEGVKYALERLAKDTKKPWDQAAKDMVNTMKWAMGQVKESLSEKPQTGNAQLGNGLSKPFVDATEAIKKYLSQLDELQKRTASILDRQESDPLQRRLEQIKAQMQAIDNFSNEFGRTVYHSATKTQQDSEGHTQKVNILIAEQGKREVINAELNREKNALAKEYADVQDLIAAKIREQTRLSTEAVDKLAKSPAPLTFPSKSDWEAQQAAVFKNNPQAASEEIQRIYSQTQTAAQQLAIEIQKINSLGLEPSVAAAAINQVKDRLDEGRIAAKQFGSEMGSALTQSIEHGFRWQNLLEQMLQSLLKYILQVTVLKGLEAKQAAGGGSSNGGSFLQALIGGIAGFRASGGPVTAGSPYVVGEKQPELFVPSTAGYIVPQLKSGAGSGITIGSIDARGTNAAEVDMRVRSGMRQAYSQALQDSSEAQRERALRRPSRARF